jgi:predicted esterase
MLGVAREFDVDGVCYLAPQAAGHTWYPHSFLVPTDDNEPYLTSALDLLASLIQRLAGRGIPPERIVLAGFSQGACLICEFAARTARRYGGIVAFTGGRIGPEDTPRDYPGTFEGTPVFLGSSDPDPHVPVARVRETSDVFEHMGAAVTMRLYPGMAHTINAEEIDAARSILAGMDRPP